MASYLSYFTSNSSSAPPQQQYSQAQPATSTWAGTFSSRIATLRKALTKDSEDDDPENEDCSHVSNVLRAYYTQKGRSFPEWLPPDPKKPQPLPQSQPQYGQYGNNYGGQYGQGTHSRGPSGGGGGLSDLWDAAPSQQRPAPQSLRAQRPAPQSVRSNDSNSRKGSIEGYPTQGSQQSYSARPLPSQQGGFQNAAAAAPTVGSRDRLRARLQGGGSGRNSPASNQTGQNPYGDSGYSGSQSNDTGGTPYASASQPWSSTGGYDNYGSGQSYESYGNPAYRQRPGGPR